MQKMRAAFHTLGCKTNHYETDALRQQFGKAGFDAVSFNEQADVYVLNTCTVTGEADRKTRQLLRRVRKQNPQAVLVALGCAVELGLDEAAINIMLGSRRKGETLERVLQLLNRDSLNDLQLQDGADREKINLKSADLFDESYEELGTVVEQSETRAYIKIEDGCNNACAYCAIPLARGRVCSREHKLIIDEARALAEAGYKEIVLTGIHLCSFGSDWKRPGEHLLELAYELSLIDGLYRIRLGSLEPRSITPDWINMASKISKLCPHFHLSLQSGSDSVLQRMNRQYLTDEFRQVAQALNEAFDTPALTTDIITGFPGETENEHRESLDFCREIGFSRMHIFRFSPRKGTKAATMPGQVNKAAMAQRSQEMSQLARSMMTSYHQHQIGRAQQIIVEKQLSNLTYSGYTDRYVPVQLESETVLQSGAVVRAEAYRCERDILLCHNAICLEP